MISPDPLPYFNVGQRVDHKRGNDVLPGIADRLSRAPLNMDNKAFGKMKRGKLKPEARIDGIHSEFSGDGSAVGFGDYW